MIKGKRIIDLTGKKFGRLVVIKEDGYIGKKTAWLCRCECGEMRRIITANLTSSSHTRSCGCLKTTIDLTRKKFGRLIVIKEDGHIRKNVVAWLCRCECGNMRRIAGGTLMSGHTKSCGCLNKIKDLTGKKFGHITVVKMEQIESGKMRWLCRCDCGNILHKVNGSELSRGRPKSCGCARGIDLTGEKFGRLTVLKKDGHIKKCIAWLCRCECGNIHRVTGNCLKSGGTKSCGCIRSGTLKLGQAAFNKLFNTYRRSAYNRGHEFLLTENQFKELTKGNCYYCGSPPKRSMLKHNVAYGDYVYNGIDRKNNSLGYVSNNCVPCCSECNLMKRKMSVNQFLEHMRKILCNFDEIPSSNP